MANDNNDNIAKLQALVGFDPTRRQSPTAELMAEVKREMLEKRLELAKAAARETLEKAFALAEQMASAERQFQAQKKKFNKELGKLINGLNNSLAGRPQEDGEEETQEGSDQ